MAQRKHLQGVAEGGKGVDDALTRLRDRLLELTLYTEENLR
jgi:hypothetical protein